MGHMHDWSSSGLRMVQTTAPLLGLQQQQGSGFGVSSSRFSMTVAVGAGESGHRVGASSGHMTAGQMQSFGARCVQTMAGSPMLQQQHSLTSLAGAAMATAAMKRAVME